MLRMLRSLVVFAIILLSMSGQISAQEFVVKLKKNPKEYDFALLEKQGNYSYKISGIEPGLNLIKIDAVTADMAKIKAIFDADYVVPNARLYMFSDPRRSEQWALDAIHAEEAWGVSRGSKQVIVAVIDTGIALAHRDLQDNLWKNSGEVDQNGQDDDNNGYIDDVNGWDFHGNDKNPEDETSTQNPGHGTHCSGIIGAVGDNNEGISGISPIVSIMPLRFLGSDGSGDLFASVKAIEYAVNNGAHIISASWGATIPQSEAQPIIEAIQKAEEKGVIFVAAAANDGKNNDRVSVYPANAQTPNMISVAASNNKDQKPYWSNYGRKVDIAAPGEDILSTIPGGYEKLSGTSMATPYVAGLVALLKSVDISLNGAQVRSILQSSGAAVAIDTASNRRIDAAAAIKAVQNKQLTVVPAAKTFKVNDEFTFSAWGGTPPYVFKSLNPEIISSDEAGHVVAKALGDAVLEVVDSAGTSALSVSIKVSDNSGGGGGGSECPLGNDFLCMIMCLFDPNLPWCEQQAEFPIPPDLPLPFPLPIPNLE